MKEKYSVIYVETSLVAMVETILPYYHVMTPSGYITAGKRRKLFSNSYMNWHYFLLSTSSD